MTAASAEATALFRYRVIAEAISPRLSPAERGGIVRDLARAQRGDAWYEPNDPHGACFCIKLPLTTRREDAQ